MGLNLQHHVNAMVREARKSLDTTEQAAPSNGGGATQREQLLDACYGHALNYAAETNKRCDVALFGRLMCAFAAVPPPEKPRPVRSRPTHIAPVTTECSLASYVIPLFAIAAAQEACKRHHYTLSAVLGADSEQIKRHHCKQATEIIEPGLELFNSPGAGARELFLPTSINILREHVAADLAAPHTLGSQVLASPPRPQSAPPPYIAQGTDAVSPSWIAPPLYRSPATEALIVQSRTTPALPLENRQASPTAPTRSSTHDDPAASAPSSSSFVAHVAQAREPEHIKPPVPRSFLCELSKELMLDPVMTPAGHVFERERIEPYVRAHHTCPVSQEQLSSADLRPSVRLRQLIARWANEHRLREGHASHVIDADVEDARFDAPVPGDFCCDLSSQLLTNPVLAPSGHVYEQQHIFAYLLEHQRCPQTGAPLAVGDLAPADDLRELVDAWVEVHLRERDTERSTIAPDGRCSFVVPDDLSTSGGEDGQSAVSSRNELNNDCESTSSRVLNDLLSYELYDDIDAPNPWA